MFFRASTPSAGPIVFDSAGSQKWRARAPPFGFGRATASQTKAQTRQTRACAAFRKTICLKRCFSAPYLRRRAEQQQHTARQQSALSRRQLLLQASLRQVAGVDAQRAEDEQQSRHRVSRRENYSFANAEEKSKFRFRRRRDDRPAPPQHDGGEADIGRLRSLNAVER